MKNKNTEKKGTAITDVINRRGFVLFLFFGVIAIALSARLIYLQTVKHDYYRKLVVEQMTYETPIKSKRGIIYDRNGVVLASNTTLERVFISPHDIKDDAQRELVCRGLSEILSVDYDTIMEKALKINRRDETIKNKVDKATADKVREFVNENGLTRVVYSVETTARLYPFSDLASQVIGFCGTDGGLFGLEYYYNSVLTGTDGKIIAARNASGGTMKYDYEAYIDAVDGNSIVTTIDYQIQAALEKHLERAMYSSDAADRAAGIVMNVKTGEIYAMATIPNYDLNNPYVLDDYFSAELAACAVKYGEDSDEYAKKKSELLYKMWNNKAISEAYEPGSTFKIVTAAIAMEEHACDPDQKFVCNGAYTVSGWRISCNKKTGHGLLTLAGGLIYSCNPVMMQVSALFGIENFTDYFSLFGYTSKTGIDLPGEGTSVYINPSSMTALDLAVYSFGQRFNVTPIQQVAAIAAVANNGVLVTPHVVSKIVSPDGSTVDEFGTKEIRQIISEDVADEICRILESGVSSDGGSKNAYVAGYKVAAKTGTSQKGTEGDIICSCIAFAPSDDPQIIVLMMIDEPYGNVYGSTVAAPYVSAFLSEALPYLGITPSYDSTVTSLSSLAGLTVDSAKAYLKNLGINNVITVGEGAYVRSQLPSANVSFRLDGATVVLYTGDAQGESSSYGVVPNVIGMTAESAFAALADEGFNVYVSGAYGGDSRVLTQSASKGDWIEKGTVITISFLFDDLEGDE